MQCIISGFTQLQIAHCQLSIINCHLTINCLLLHKNVLLSVISAKMVKKWL